MRVNAGPIVPAASAALTGTITASVTAADIVAGGKTIILTLTNDTFVAAGATFDAQRQNIINGLLSAQSEATGWNLVVKAGLGVGTVVRTSNTVVTITLSAFATYAVSLPETITATLPATALTGGIAVVASPTFGIAVNAGWTSVFSSTVADYTTKWTGENGNVSDDGTYVIQTFNTGLAGGSAPATMYNFMSSSTPTLCRIRVVGFKISGAPDPLYLFHTAGNIKIGFMNINGSAKFVPQTFGAQGTASVARLGFGLQSCVNYISQNFGNGDGPVITRGVECDEIIWELKRNTTGVADGYVRMYYDGVLAVSVEDVEWTASASTFDENQWAPVFGGNGGAAVGSGYAQPPGWSQAWREWHVEVPV